MAWLDDFIYIPLPLKLIIARQVITSWLMPVKGGAGRGGAGRGGAGRRDAGKGGAIPAGPAGRDAAKISDKQGR